MKGGHKAARAVHTAPAATTEAKDDVGAFLGALSGLLHDTVLRLEETVGQVTGKVVSQPSLVDRDMVVALQDFDRLHQEFVALGKVLAGYAAKRGEPAEMERESLLLELLGAVPVHDFRQRLIDCMVDAKLLKPDPATIGNDAVF